MHRGTQNWMHFKLPQLAARELQESNRFKALARHRICTGYVSFHGHCESYKETVRIAEFNRNVFSNLSITYSGNNGRDQRSIQFAK